MYVTEIFQTTRKAIDQGVQMSKRRKIIIAATVFAAATLIGAGFIAHRYYQYIKGPNLTAPEGFCEIFIYPESSFEDVVEAFKGRSCLKNIYSFEWVASRMGYTESSIRPGRYLFQNGMANRYIIGKLRSGNQDAVNVTIIPGRDLGFIAERAARNILADSASIMEFFTSDRLQTEFGIDMTGLKTRILPNTYQMWWNTGPIELVERLLKEYSRFWQTNDRLAKAEKLNLSPEEVIILASIVESETNYVPEMPTIAGVYLNRLKSGWLLQADPTVVFALGNPGIRRVLTRDLEVDSPYNTYKNPGLPPGPINIPSIHAIEAVLNPDSHEYYYFCARPDNSGTHVFSKTLSAHLNNARQFQNWLNRQRIMR